MTPKIRNFLYDTFLGTAVLVPIILIGLLYEWVGNVIKNIITPVQPYLPDLIAKSDFFSALIVIGLSVMTVFLIGLIMRTSLGKMFHGFIEKKILIPYAPGYRFIVESVKPFMPNNKKKPFKHAVMAFPFGRDAAFIVGFITDEHETMMREEYGSNKIIVVYNPTAPVPTSGLIYNCKAEDVKVLQGASVDDAMKPVISCGVGMAALFRNHEKELSKAAEKINYIAAEEVNKESA